MRAHPHPPPWWTQAHTDAAWLLAACLLTGATLGALIAALTA